MSSDSDLERDIGLGEQAKEIEVDLKYAFSSSILQDVDVGQDLKTDLINFNKVEKNTEKIGFLVKDELKRKMTSNSKHKPRKLSKGSNHEFSVNPSEQDEYASNITKSIHDQSKLLSF